jgi:hypothetical protein
MCLIFQHLLEETSATQDPTNGSRGPGRLSSKKNLRMAFESFKKFKEKT